MVLYRNIHLATGPLQCQILVYCYTLSGMSDRHCLWYPETENGGARDGWVHWQQAGECVQDDGRMPAKYGQIDAQPQPKVAQFGCYE